jgi:hypothetical protein
VKCKGDPRRGRAGTQLVDGRRRAQAVVDADEEGRLAQDDEAEPGVQQGDDPGQRRQATTQRGVPDDSDDEARIGGREPRARGAGTEIGAPGGRCPDSG